MALFDSGMSLVDSGRSSSRHGFRFQRRLTIAAVAEVLRWRAFVWNCRMTAGSSLTDRAVVTMHALWEKVVQVPTSPRPHDCLNPTRIEGHSGIRRYERGHWARLSEFLGS